MRSGASTCRRSCSRRARSSEQLVRLRSFRRVGRSAPSAAEAALQKRDACPCQPAVGLELGLARAPRPHSAPEPLEVLPHPAHAREVVLELRELDLELALGAARVLREDVEDQLRAIDDARLQRVLERALLRRAELVVDEEDLRRRARSTPSSARRASPSRRRFAGRGGAGAARAPRRGRHPRCGRAHGARRAPRRRPTPFGKTPTSEPALRLRPRCGIGLARSHSGIMPLYAGAVTALAERLAARTLELVEHPVRERPRGRDSRSPPLPRARGPASASTRATRLPLRAPAPDRAPSIVLAGHYDTVPAQDNLPGRIDGRRRSRAWRERHEGWCRGRARARPRSRSDTRRRSTSRFSSSGAKSFRPSTIRFPPFRGVRAGARGGARDPARAHRRTHSRGLPRERRRAPHVPRTERPLGAPVGRRQCDRARSRRARGRFLRSSRERQSSAGFEFVEVVSVTRFESGIADNVIPGEATVTVNLRYPPDRSPDDAEAYLRSLVPAGATLEIVESLAAGSVVADGPARRRAPGRRRPTRRAEASVDERRRLHCPSGSRRGQLRPRSHAIAHTARTSSSRSRHSCTHTRLSSRFLTRAIREDGGVMDLAARIDDLWESGRARRGADRGGDRPARSR